MFKTSHHPSADEFMKNVADHTWRWGNDMLEPNDVLSVAEAVIIPIYAECGAASVWCGTPFFINIQVAFVKMFATKAEWDALKHLEDICRELLLRNFPVLARLPATTHIDDLTEVTANLIRARARHARAVEDQKLELAQLRHRWPTPANLVRRLAKWLSISMNSAAVARMASAPSDALADAITACLVKERNRAIKEMTTVSPSALALASFTRRTFGLDPFKRAAAA